MIWAIVVAAGRGERFGTAKQFASLGDRRVVDWSLSACRAVADGVVLVAAADRVAGLAADPDLLADQVVAGGATRSESVRAGLDAVPSTAEVVVVHDAARPMASPALVRAVVDALADGVDGAIPVLPVSDTVKQVDADGTVVATLDRSALVSVQTPQAFRASSLRAAHAGRPEATDDAAVVEQWGGRVVTVPGEPDNRKITIADDLEHMRTMGGPPRLEDRA
jgi:2-C-methyl-D-erythritol 4-phosphate cytidylyltransferase